MAGGIRTKVHDDLSNARRALKAALKNDDAPQVAIIQARLQALKVTKSKQKEDRAIKRLEDHTSAVGRQVVDAVAAQVNDIHIALEPLTSLVVQGGDGPSQIVATRNKVRVLQAQIAVLRNTGRMERDAENATFLAASVATKVRKADESDERKIAKAAKTAQNAEEKAVQKATKDAAKAEKVKEKATKDAAKAEEKAAKDAAKAAQKAAKDTANAEKAAQKIKDSEN